MMKSWRILAFLLIAIAVVGVLIWRGQEGAEPILLRDGAARVIRTDGADALMISATIENAGGPDRLVAAASTAAEIAKLVPASNPQGLPIPAKSAPSLSPDGASLMLFGLEGPLDEGRLVPFTLTFAEAGEVSGKATLRLGAPGGEMVHAAADEPPAGPPPDGPTPTISVSAEPAEDGWRIIADAGNFRFAPAEMDGAHEPGEGHAHLYVDGLKILRMTGPEVTIGALPEGRHEVRVALNSNDHRPYMADGEPVAATTAIEVE